MRLWLTQGRQFLALDLSLGRLLKGRTSKGATVPTRAEERVSGSLQEVGQHIHGRATLTFGRRWIGLWGGEFINRDTEMIPLQMTTSTRG